MPLRKIAFVFEDFAPGTPSQQLLDRFLIGYPRDGEFRRFADLQIAVWLSPPPENSTVSIDAVTALAMRERDFNLSQLPTLAATLADAGAIILAASGERISVGEELLRSVLEQAPAGAACFVHGCLAPTAAIARQFSSIAAARKLTLVSGTSTATTFRLPDVDVPAETALSEALIVVQGPHPLAELLALDGLLPVIARRRGGESGIASVRHFAERNVWRAGDKGEWSWPLLAAALSRSNTAQGDAVRDGRTQDLAGLGLVRKLAREPRAWVIEHRDGLRSTLLVLDGVVADFNFAVRARDGTIISAQLYRPPAPNRREFDRLTAVLEDFFRTNTAPWPPQRSVFVSEFIEKAVR